MYRSILITLVFVSSYAAGQSNNAPEPNRPSAAAGGSGQTPASAAQPEPNDVRVVLDRLQNHVNNLKSYQCKIDYIYRQPVLESTERRKGTLQYARMDGRSYLYIDFTSHQFNTEPEQKKREQYLFDGVWLTFVDHESHNVQRRQVAEPNAPVDAFALVGQRVPIVGFAKVEDLEKQFDIETVPLPADAAVYQLHMKAKPDSTYKDDYATVDVQIDKKIGLPVKIKAVTPAPDQDEYEISLTDAKVNESIPKSVFEISYPKDYSVEVVPLERKSPPKGQP